MLGASDRAAAWTALPRDRFGGEGLAQLRLVVGREVGLDDLEVHVPHLFGDAVQLDIAREEEQRRMARLDRLADFRDERVVDADVPEPPGGTTGFEPDQPLLGSPPIASPPLTTPARRPT